MADMPDEAMEKLIAEAHNERPDPRFWLELVVIMDIVADINRQEAADVSHPGQAATQYMIFNLAKLFAKQSYFLQRGEICAPMLKLSMALFDLNHGRVSPMLKPSARSNGNPGRTISFGIIKGTAARALTELLEGGTPAPEAAQMVAASLRAASKRGLGQVTAHTVANWRSRLEQGEGPGASKVELLAYQGTLSPHLGDTPKARGHNLLNELQNLAAELA